MSESLTLLFVDDEPNLLRSYQRALRGSEYEVRTAGSGSEALALLKTHPVHVVISDYRMPGMTGIEFLKQVKQLQPKAVRVILSGYADEASIEEAIQHGEVMMYLLKPMDNELLREKVAQFFRIYQASSASP